MEFSSSCFFAGKNAMEVEGGGLELKAVGPRVFGPGQI